MSTDQLHILLVSVGCALGVGVAVLPRPLGDATPGLRRIDLGDEPPGRDVWLGYHRDLRHLPRLRAFVDEVIQLDL